MTMWNLEKLYKRKTAALALLGSLVVLSVTLERKKRLQF